MIRLVIPNLDGPGTETAVSLAADNADTSRVPSDAVILWPDEVADMSHARALDPLLWEVKRRFAPHARSHPEPDSREPT